MLKIFDRYVIKSFIQPFFAAFFIVLFVLIMQALWLVFDQIAGKGIDLIFILKFVGYLALTVTPMALPIGILLSSIMAMGNLAENYELAAIKSAGVPLSRVMRPLVFFTLIIGVFSFFFMNNVYPWATLKQKNLYINIKNQEPALALVPGAFNTEIPGYNIKFEEKYGKNKNFLKNVQISDITKGNGKVKVITAKKGSIISEDGSKYMTLNLEDGNYYEEHAENNYNQKKMPASKATFKKYSINIDVSSFNSNEDLEKENYKSHYTMLSINQLDSISKETKKDYDQILNHKLENFYSIVKGNELYKHPDSIINKSLKKDILQNFELHNQTIVANNAERILRRITSSNDKYAISVAKNKRKVLNLFDFEPNYRITFSLACLVLFFIGAPLGSIIRKGGFGLPLVVAIVIFVIYFFITKFSQNLSEESAISATLGGWISTIILLPFGLLLTLKATKGTGVFNINSTLNKIKQLFQKQTKRNEKQYI